MHKYRLLTVVILIVAVSYTSCRKYEPLVVSTVQSQIDRAERYFNQEIKTKVASNKITNTDAIIERNPLGFQIRYDDLRVAFIKRLPYANLLILIY